LGRGGPSGQHDGNPPVGGSWSESTGVLKSALLC
jgi:hypothetical protein